MSSNMEKAEILSSEIEKMKFEVYNLERTIKEKTEELLVICPHEKTREEYDNDFHNPHRYRLCVTCKAEFKI